MGRCLGCDLCMGVDVLFFTMCSKAVLDLVSHSGLDFAIVFGVTSLLVTS